MGGVTHSDLRKALEKHSTEIDTKLVESLRRLLQEAGFTHSHVSNLVDLFQNPFTTSHCYYINHRLV